MDHGLKYIKQHPARSLQEAHGLQDEVIRSLTRPMHGACKGGKRPIAVQANGSITIQSADRTSRILYQVCMQVHVSLMIRG